MFKSKFNERDGFGLILVREAHIDTLTLSLQEQALETRTCLGTSADDILISASHQLQVAFTSAAERG